MILNMIWKDHVINNIDLTLFYVVTCKLTDLGIFTAAEENTAKEISWIFLKTNTKFHERVPRYICLDEHLEKKWSNSK